MFVRTVDQFRYRTTQEGIVGVSGEEFGAGYTVVAVEAEEVGTAGNTDQVEGYTLAEPIANLSNDVVIEQDHAIVLHGGEDPETLERHRERIQERQQEPEGPGTDSDYEQWARDALETVDRVFVTANDEANGPGTVLVQFLVQLPEDGDPEDIFPTPGNVSTVDDALQAARPITAELTTSGPTPYVVDMSIQIRPNTSEVQAAVLLELIAMSKREGKPGGTIDNSKWRGAISATPGEDAHKILDLDGDEDGLGDVSIPAFHFPRIGTITWSTLP